MPVRLRLLLFCSFATAALVGGAIGCRPSEPSKRAEKADAPPKQQKPKEETAATARPESGAKGDPADALNQFLSDLAAGRGDAVYSALPDRYRQDLERFLAETVRSIKPDDRRRAAESIARFADALRAKKEFVLASERFEIAGPAAGFVRGRFDSVCRVVAAGARWPGWAEPKAGDARLLASTVVSAFASDADLTGELKDLRFEPVSQSGDEAVVRIRGTGEAQGREVSVVRIDGAWVPTTFSERWEAMFEQPAPATAQADGAAGLTSFAERLDEVTKALAEVSTQAEFDALADEAATALLAVAAQADTEPRALKPEEFVTVEVLGPLTDEQKDRIVWELTTQTDESVSGLAEAVDLTDREGITVTVGPVADVKAFARRLAGLKVERLDTDKKTVTARFSGP